MVHCNVGLTEAEEKRRLQIIGALAGAFQAHGLKVRVQGDPRGVAVRVFLPGTFGNLWGGEGEWGVTWTG